MVAMTRDEWVSRALGRVIPIHSRRFGAFGALPAPVKAPMVGAIPAINAAQVTTREVAQQIADSMSRFARGAYDSAVNTLNAAAGFPDSAAWKTRVQQQADSAVGYRNQVFQSTSVTRISWPFVQTTLQNARNQANMALGTAEQIAQVVATWTREQDASRQQAARDQAAREQAAALEAERQRAEAQLAAQQAQLDATRQMVELQRQLAEQQGATAEELTIQRSAEAELAAAQAALDAWAAAHPTGGGDVHVSVSAGGGGGGGGAGMPAGGAGLMPDDAGLTASTAEPAIPKILLYALAGLAALKILKG